MPTQSRVRSVGIEPLATKHLRLRQFEARDVDGLHTCFGDPDAMRYWNFPVAKSKDATARWVRAFANAKSPHSTLAWSVADKCGDRCIGMVNYHHREPRNKRLEIGYILARANSGKGLMTEAVAALIDYCFKELGVHRIEAMIHPDNAASIRLAERLGFQREGGPLRDYWRVGDRYLSAMVYSLINEDRAKPAAGKAPKPSVRRRSR